MESYSASTLIALVVVNMGRVNLSNSSKRTFKIVHFILCEYTTIELIKNEI